jgi:hypothetical protein
MPAATLRITTPVIIDPSAGLFIRDPLADSGFSIESASFLSFLADGAGTAIANRVSGGAAGALTSQVSSGNASAWQATGSGGGLEVEGGMGVSTPATDLRNAWTIIVGGKVTGSVNDGTARNYQLISFIASATTNFRGAFLALTGGTTWNPPVVNQSYDVRVSNGAGAAGGANSFGSSSAAIGNGRVWVLGYDGSANITGAIYDKNGNLLFSVTVATNDTNLVTGFSGVVQNTVQPFIGPYPSATWCGGKRIIEAIGVYTRVLPGAEIVNWCTAAAALATARSRAW